MVSTVRTPRGAATVILAGALVVAAVLVAADPAIRDELVGTIGGERDAGISLSLVGASPTPGQFSLTVNKAGTGKGKVNVWFTNDTQAQLIATCAADQSTCKVYIGGSQYQGFKLHVQAIAATGHVFAGWTGTAGCGSDAKCSLAFPFSSSTFAVTAAFTAPSPTPTPTPARLTATPSPTR